MKKVLLTVLLLVATAMSAAAYQFSDVAPSGQTLYYNIVDGNAQVTYQYYVTMNNNYSELTGNLIIPSTVTYNGITYSVTSIGDYAFSKCTGMTSVSIPKSVTEIGLGVFSGCTGLTEPVYNNLIFAYFPCGYASSYSIPTGITLIASFAFADCEGLTHITIPNSVTEIRNWAFRNCIGLTTVSLPNSVTEVGVGAFYGCTGLTTPVYNSHVFAYFPCGYATSYSIPNGITKIAGYAFSNCENLSSVTIPNSVTEIDFGGFHNCPGLTEPLYNSHVFAYFPCGYATHYSIPTGIEKIAPGVFESCRTLTSINIPNSVTEIGDEAFYGCSGLTTVTIPNSVTKIGEWAFMSCSGLTSVTLSSPVLEIGDRAFYQCTGLTSVYYNGNVANWCGFKFFNGSSNPLAFARKLYINGSLLKDLTIPNGVTKINDFTFLKSEDLRSVSLPNTLNCIGWSGFANDSALTTITLPESLDSLANWSLGRCVGLSSIRSKSPIPPKVGDTSTFTCIDKTIPVYVPYGSAAAYSTAFGWSLFSNFIESDMTAIDEPSKPTKSITITSRDGAIHIDGEASEPVLIYDLTGRMFHQGRVKSPVHVPTSGIYMVKVGDRQPQKVVVR